MYVWLENLGFVGFLESYSLSPVPWKEISESFVAFFPVPQMK